MTAVITERDRADLRDTREIARDALHTGALTVEQEPVTHSENMRRSALGFALTGLCRAGLHDVTAPANVSRGRCRPCRNLSNYASRDRRAAR